MLCTDLYCRAICCAFIKRLTFKNHADMREGMR